MAASTFTLKNFTSQILDKSLARTNRFEVIITPPFSLAAFYNSLGVSLMVEQASLPMLNVATKPFKIFGPSYQKPITSEYGGEGISLNFHIDRDMRLKKFFDDWMHAVVNPTTYTVGYQRDYIGTIEIHQLNEQDKITYSVILEEAFPRNMNLVDLNHTASNQTHRLNVLFAYRKWKEVKIEPVIPVSIPEVVQNPQVPRQDYRNVETNQIQNIRTNALNDLTGVKIPPTA